MGDIDDQLTGTTHSTEPSRLIRFRRSITSLWQRMSWTVRSLLLFVLGAVFAGIVGAIIDKPIDDAWQSSKPHPFIAVILSQDEREFTIPLELKNGMQEGGQSINGPNGENVRIEYLTPARTVKETREVVRSKCLDLEECIAIVGGADSTTTEAALLEILDYKYEKGRVRPALIAPIATATKISQIAARYQYSSLLRLVPSNRDQAQRITSFIAKKKPSQRVLIVRDDKNPTYAQDLTENLQAAIGDNGGDPRVLQYVDSSTLQNAKIRGLRDIDYIIFVGTSETGLNIIADLKRYGITTPTIFTDGNTVREAISSSIGAPGEIYFLTPVRELNNFSEPGYTAIGRDTFAILNIIISSAHGADRESVADMIANRKYDISLTQGAAGDYKFGADGENSEMSFQIFTAKDGKLLRQIRY